MYSGEKFLKLEALFLSLTTFTEIQFLCMRWVQNFPSKSPTAKGNECYL